MTRLLTVLLVLGMAGCDLPEQTTNNQCLRAEIFKQCLAQIPEGPERTVYNDWAEVVDACESAAYYQSLRKISQIPKGCR